MATFRIVWGTARMSAATEVKCEFDMEKWARKNGVDFSGFPIDMELADLNNAIFQFAISLVETGGIERTKDMRVFEVTRIFDEEETSFSDTNAPDRG